MAAGNLPASAVAPAGNLPVLLAPLAGLEGGGVGVDAVAVGEMGSPSKDNDPATKPNAPLALPSRSSSELLRRCSAVSMNFINSSSK